MEDFCVFSDHTVRISKSTRVFVEILRKTVLFGYYTPMTFNFAGPLQTWNSNFVKVCWKCFPYFLNMIDASCVTLVVQMLLLRISFKHIAILCFLKWACLELCDNTMEWVCTYGTCAHGTSVKPSTLDRCAADCGVLAYTLGACTGISHTKAILFLFLIFM